MRPWCGVRARVSGRFGLNVVDICRPSWGAILTEKMRATLNGYQLALLVQARFRTPRPNARMHEGTSAPPRGHRARVQWLRGCQRFGALLRIADGCAGYAETQTRPAPPKRSGTTRHLLGSVLGAAFSS